VKPKIGVIELGKGNLQVPVPVSIWEEMEEVRRGVVDYLTISGEEMEATQLMEIEGIYWFIIWAKWRPDLLKAIEISVLTVLKRLRKRKALEVLTVKVYHPQMKTFIIRVPDREEGLKLREAMVEYIEDQLKGGIKVSEMDYQGVMEVTCPIDKMERLIGPLQHCMSSRKILGKEGRWKQKMFLRW